jgi:predicted GH43/DUF377 family glycosyl hydrolase
MIHLQRLGVILAPDQPEPCTTALFNAGMACADTALEGEVVHMLYRYAEWRPAFDPLSQSNYAVDVMRYARLSPDGQLLYDSRRDPARPALLAPSLPWDVSGCQDARIVPFEGCYYLIYCGWDKDTAPPGQDKARVGIARLPYPILEPEEDYECFGDVNNVVFPVGGYLYQGDLYISYGGADRVVALAKAPLAALLAELEKFRN